MTIGGPAASSKVRWGAGLSAKGWPRRESGAAGLVSLVSLFAALEGLRPERHADRLVVVLLDEPEAHLHPKLQGEVGLALASIAREFDAQLIMATHSVELINRLGGRGGTALVHVDRRQKVGVELLGQSAVIEALDAFCDLTPFTALNFLASRRVLFHEGKSDFSFLDACANILFRSDPPRLARWKAYLPIALDGVGNVSAHGVFAKLLVPRVFARLGQTEKTRVALVLDADADREAKLEWSKKLPPNLEGIECVWPRYSIESLFLEPEVLAAWIEPLFPGRSVLQAVREACEQVNRDQELNDAAEDTRVKVLRRASGDDKALTDTAAHKRARTEVRGDPARFQHGRNRAKKVLAALSTSLGPGLRGDLEAIVRAADPNALEPTRVIPDAIRALLERLVGDPPART